jgi:hypothetical protein
MKAAVFHRPNMHVLIRYFDFDALQEGEPLLHIVAAGVSPSYYHLIQCHRTPKEVTVHPQY